MAATRKVHLKVNGAEHDVEVESRRLLSDVLRHDLGLSGTHVGCEQGACGACTILLDGYPARSCLLFAVSAEGAEITTIEGLSSPTQLNPLQTSFQNHHALQCGYCTPAMLLTAHALLRKNPNVEADEVRDALSGNLCRCTGYQNIVEAVVAARSAYRGEHEEGRS